MNRTTNSPKISITDINTLASKKIYFGHQSVGYNIIDTLKAMLPVNSGLRIMETDDLKDFSNSIFAHSKNGENFKPETKIASFVKKMDSGLGNKVDIAFFKLCYVDISAESDVNKLFVEYKTAMDGLVKKYPKTMFLYMTTPLTTENISGIKNKIKLIIKSMIGKKTGDVYDNIKRMEFNGLLRKEYGAKVFDLAAIESSDVFGKEMLSDKGGVKHQMLFSHYTNDGGHLNDEGGEIVLSRLVAFVVNIIVKN